MNRKSAKLSICFSLKCPRPAFAGSFDAIVVHKQITLKGSSSRAGHNARCFFALFVV